MKKILLKIWKFIRNLFKKQDKKQDKKTTLKWRGINPICETTKNQ